MAGAGAGTARATVRVGVDIGGTFTDVMLLLPDGRPVTQKVSTTPDDYSRAVIAGIRGLLERVGVASGAVAEVVHGTTVATNTVLEHTGARTGLLTTRGFRDVLEIRRIRSPELYNPLWQKPPPLVQRRHRLEATERIDRWGRIERPLDLAEAEAAIERLLADGIESLAVCFINAYVNPAHEQAVGELVRQRWPDLPLSLSCEVLPEIREYERTSTTVINAYLLPRIERYLGDLDTELRRAGVTAPLLMMQSNGGSMPARAARARPIHIVESGPAAGVIAAARLARALDLPDVLTFDMGGTTAKASIVAGGEVSRTAEYEVGGGLSMTSRLIRGDGYALRVPVLDIAEVGAGGGSIVWLDPGGALQVGPRSAGAAPGPVCYGLGGTEPTVTDANVVLGYLNPAYLCGGEVRIDADRSRAVLAERVAGPLGLSLHAAAHGVHLVANSVMQRALRAVSTQRGRDPRGYTLIAFGGNGPTHAAELARAMEIPRVIVPAAPGLFSAHGLLLAEPQHHYVRGYFRDTATADPAELARLADEMAREARATLAEESHPPDRITLAWSADLRYAGQAYELNAPLGAGPIDRAELAALVERFAAEHERTYGYRNEPGHPVDLVNLRLVATGQPLAVAGSAPPRGDVAAAADGATGGVIGASGGAGVRPAYFGAAGLIETPVIARGQLAAEPRPGPLIIEEYDTTIVVPPGCTAALDRLGNVVLEVGA